MLYGFVDVGNFVMIYLNENDLISIKLYVLINIILFGIVDEIYIIFIGVLLKFDIVGKRFLFGWVGGWGVGLLYQLYMYLRGFFFRLICRIYCDICYVYLNIDRQWFIFIEYVYKKVIFFVGFDYYFYVINGEIVMYNDIIFNSNVYNFFIGRFIVLFDGIYIFYYYGFV